MKPIRINPGELDVETLLDMQMWTDIRRCPYCLEEVTEPEKWLFHRVLDVIADQDKPTTILTEAFRCTSCPILWVLRTDDDFPDDEYQPAEIYLNGFNLGRQMTELVSVFDEELNIGPILPVDGLEARDAHVPHHHVCREHRPELCAWHIDRPCGVRSPIWTRHLPTLPPTA